MDETSIDLATLRQNEIGNGASIETPFGPRLIYYADFTASGRFLRFVEDWMSQVRPYYANSHTVISTTGAVMTSLREQARAAVKRSVNAAPDDVVMFVGSGATAAVNKLAGLLWLDAPNPAYGGFTPEQLPPDKRPLVLVGPHEHHSNQLPWIESIAEVLEVGETAAGHVDLADLDAKLAAAGPRPLVIGSFAAASNVTGVLSDVRAIARVLHARGALAFFDYAACGPYAPIDMHPAGDPGGAIDALFVSTHKFAGGPQGSGVLVASPRCFLRTVPERPGGGTVEYVSNFGRHAVDYVPRLDEREEGGTPAIIGDIRAGLAFMVKDAVGAAGLLAHELELGRAAVARLAKNPRIQLLGPCGVDRLPILSFNIAGLHHDFASILLDHLFGIQSRAGCGCAGPYGHRLLGVTRAQSLAYRGWILRGVQGIKPGWVRVTLPPYASDADVAFVLAAIEFVADHGEALLPDYALNWRDGVWRHRGWSGTPVALSLTLESLLAGPTRAPAPTDEATLAATRAGYFREAHAIATRARARAAEAPPRFNPPTGSAALDALVWFRYIHAADDALLHTDGD